MNDPNMILAASPRVFRWCYLLLLQLCLWAVAPVQASQTLDIYKASALVKNQSEAERNRAARATLGEVVVRVSGQLGALDNPQVQAAAARAEHFLFGFSYRTSDARIQEGDKSLEALEVQLDFSPEAIKQLLREAQLPLWPAQRPQILVWPWVKDEKGVRPELGEELVGALRQRAAYRGLPLVFSKQDIEDQLALAPLRAWRFDYTAIQLASLRYRSDASLTLRLTPSTLGPIPNANYEARLADEPDELPVPLPAVEPVAIAPEAAALDTGEAEAAPPMLLTGPWLADAQLLQRDEHHSFSGEQAQLGLLLAQVIDQVADELARQYAIQPGAQSEARVFLRVAGATEFSTYKNLQSYLGGLAMVKHLDVVQVDGEGQLFGLLLEGDVRLLVSTLGLERRIQPQDPVALLAALAQQQGAAVVPAETVAQPDEAVLAAQLDALILGEADVPVPAAAPAGGPALGSTEAPLQYVWSR